MAIELDPEREAAIQDAWAAETRLHEAEQWRRRVTDMGQVEPALRELDDARRAAAAAWDRVHEEYLKAKKRAGDAEDA
ncbi:MULTISPECIES: hypothetical protein [Streptomyces]|uniref:Uncharacterized protein n=2 Tax=Streptomyces TaxID=1883 RepID=A0ABN1T7L7_9ACTN